MAKNKTLLFTGKYIPNVSGEEILKTYAMGRTMARDEILAILRKYIPDAYDEELLNTYAMVGINPDRLRRMSGNFQRDLLENFLQPVCPLFHEGRHITWWLEGKTGFCLRSILECVAGAHRDMQDIAEMMDYDSYECAKMINALLEYGILEWQNGKLEIRDLYLRFWYIFILNFKTVIENNMGHRALVFIEKHFPAYMARIPEIQN